MIKVVKSFSLLMIFGIIFINKSLISMTVSMPTSKPTFNVDQVSKPSKKEESPLKKKATSIQRYVISKKSQIARLALMAALLGGSYAVYSYMQSSNVPNPPPNVLNIPNKAQSKKAQPLDMMATFVRSLNSDDIKKSIKSPIESQDKKYFPGLSDDEISKLKKEAFVIAYAREKRAIKSSPLDIVSNSDIIQDPIREAVGFLFNNPDSIKGLQSALITFRGDASLKPEGTEISVAASTWKHIIEAYKEVNN